MDQFNKSSILWCLKLWCFKNERLRLGAFNRQMKAPRPWSRYNFLLLNENNPLHSFFSIAAQSLLRSSTFVWVSEILDFQKCAVNGESCTCPTFWHFYQIYQKNVENMSTMYDPHPTLLRHSFDRMRNFRVVIVIKFDKLFDLTYL